MKTIWHTIIVIAALTVTLVLPACETEVGESMYQITPLREREPAEEGEEDVYDVPMDMVAHLFMDVEGANWKVLSYEDAVQGVLSDTISEVHATLSSDATFEQQEDGSLLLGALQGERRHYIVVCNREDEIYAWRELKTVADAGTIYLTLYFRPWRERKTLATTYTETGWTMVNKLEEEEEEEEEDPLPLRRH